MKGKKLFTASNVGKIKIDIEKDSIDKFIEMLGWAAILILITLPIYYYSQLPYEIPIHFNFSGEVDGYGSKITIWILVVIEVAMYVGLNTLNKFPHIFNYPVKITEVNVRIQYKLATRMIRMMNTLIAVTFAYIEYSIIQSALYGTLILKVAYLYSFLILLFGLIIYYFWRSFKAK